MAFEELRENIAEKATEISERIKESEAYILIKERYDILNPSAQQALKIVSITAVTLLLLYIPFSNYISTSDPLDEYEVKRADLSDFLKARAAGNLGNIAKEKSFSQVKSEIDRIIQNAGLIEEQIGEVTTYSQNSGFIPKGIKETGLQLELKKLNLTQIRDISFSLQEKIEDTILTGLDIKATTDKEHYFDVIFILKNLFIPDDALGIGKEKDSKKKGRSRRKGN